MIKPLLVSLTLTFSVSLGVSPVRAQGTIQFLNTALNKIKYIEDPCLPEVDAPVGTYVGVFYGTSPDSLQLSTPTARVSIPGLFNGGSAYALNHIAIPTNPGMTVYVRIAAWYNKFGPTPETISGRSGDFTHYGETVTVQATLGPTAGPGTVIWQSTTGSNPNRMKPFAMSNLTPCPEPTTWTIGALAFGALASRRTRARRPNRG